MKNLALLFVLLLTLSCARATQSPLAVAVDVADFGIPSVTFENFSQTTYYGFAKATVPFAKGDWFGGKPLTALTEDGEAVEFLPLKYYLENGDAHSVSLAQAIFRAKLPAGRRTINFKKTPTKVEPFEFGSELLKFIQAGTLQQHIVAAYTAPNGTPCYASVDGAWEWMQATPRHNVLRIRNHPTCNGVVNKQVSFTWYWELLSKQNHGNFYLVVGNDTLEAPVSGGLQIGSIDLLVKPPFEMGVFYPSGWAFGGVANNLGFRSFKLMQNTTLADAQTFTFKGRWGVFSGATQFERESFLIAANQSPLLEMIGTSDFDAVKAMPSFGAAGFFPNRRATESQMRQAVAYHCTQNLTGGPAAYFGEINKNPPITGAQPDFMSNVPIFLQQAIHGQTMCPARSALLAVLKESWRPSFYWWTPPNGIERRVDSADWPELFFWSSRLHWVWSWNSGKGADIWQNRIGLNEGNRQTWEPYDTQHIGWNSLHGIYELTGDVWVGDVIKYYQTILFWNYFGGRYSVPGGYNPYHRGGWPRIDTDRGFGRTYKMATQSLEYFPYDAPLLKQNLKDKLALIIKPLMAQNKAAKGTAFLHEQDHDPRLQLSTDCVNGAFVAQGVQPNNCNIVIAWQYGLLAEGVALAIKNGQNKADAMAIGQMLMDDLPKFFKPNGEAKSMFLIANPNIYAEGGYHLSWWAGWFMMAKYFPNHPNQAVLNAFKPQFNAFMESRNPQDQHWKNQDNWMVQ